MNDNNLVKIETEDGKTLNLLILEEFEYKNKKYALLSELDHMCECEEDCDCEKCDCDDEDLYLLEITKDKDGSEIFKSIDDEKLFDEVSSELEKLLDK